MSCRRLMGEGPAFLRGGTEVVKGASWQNSEKTRTKLNYIFPAAQSEKEYIRTNASSVFFS